MQSECGAISQLPYRCRLEWGRRGAQLAAERGDIVVIVDTLSFSSVIATATHYGVEVYPCINRAEADITGKLVGAEVAVRRVDVPTGGRYSLSPLTYVNADMGARVALASPNGATCARIAKRAPAIYAGTLLNASATAAAIALDCCAHNVTVLACGERWKSSDDDGELRFAIEDYLGAGAILSLLPGAKSPEARLCELAFTSARSDLLDLLMRSSSGTELCEAGFADDVRHAASLDKYDNAAVLREERFVGIATS